MPLDKLKSMRRKPPKREGKSDAVSSFDESPFAYGLRVDLDDESLTSLGMKTMPAVGTKMAVYAVAEVVAVRENESIRNGKKSVDRNVELQLQRMAVEPVAETGGITGATKSK